MQYKTRESALKALAKITHERCYLLPEEAMSPAEYWLISILIKTSLARERNKSKTINWRPHMERYYRDLKSIARGLGLFPIPDWAEKYVKVNERMSTPLNNRNGATIEIRGDYSGSPPARALRGIPALVKATEEILTDYEAMETYIAAASAEHINENIHRAMYGKQI